MTKSIEIKNFKDEIELLQRHSKTISKISQHAQHNMNKLKFYN
jgi:hypothetical protein